MKNVTALRRIARGFPVPFLTILFHDACFARLLRRSAGCGVRPGPSRWPAQGKAAFRFPWQGSASCVNSGKEMKSILDIDVVTQDTGLYFVWDWASARGGPKRLWTFAAAQMRATPFRIKGFLEVFLPWDCPH